MTETYKFTVADITPPLATVYSPIRSATGTSIPLYPCIYIYTYVMYICTGCTFAPVDVVVVGGSELPLPLPVPSFAIMLNVYDCLMYVYILNTFIGYIYHYTLVCLSHIIPLYPTSPLRLYSYSLMPLHP